MVIAMVPHPRDRVARKRNGRAGGEKEPEPARHLESAMGQVAMQIKRRADARPEIDGEHERQVVPLKLRAETDDAQDLQADQRNEEIKIELVVDRKSVV